MLTTRLQPVSLVIRTALVALVAAGALAGCGRSALIGAPVGANGFDAQSATATAPSAAVTAYYKKVNALTGKPLLTALSKLVAGQRELEYDTARDHMFATVNDPDGDNVVQDVYLGKRSAGVTDRKSAFHRGLNAEHSWPQSMGAKEGPARSDLHHLFPSEAGANSQRNNSPFGTVVAKAVMLPDLLGDGLHSRVGDGVTGTTVFEPRADHRGDLARAMFYFYARYVVENKVPAAVSTANFKLEQDTLLKWHLADPVTTAEKTRSEAIYKIQGNRNPFVDHPEYVKKIGKFLPTSGGKGSEEWGDDGL